LYALPNDFPGYQEAQRIADPYEKVFFLEKAMGVDINERRFLPYLQLHEFEALIFAEPPTLLEEYPDRQDAIQKLQNQLAEEFNGNPELINEGRETAPSKRIENSIPEYDKVSSGPLVTELIGIDFLKEKCQHFNAWISTLENLASNTH